MTPEEAGLNDCPDCFDTPSRKIVARAVERELFYDDEADERSVCGLLRLKDGRYATFSQWADYTGHG